MQRDETAYETLGVSPEATHAELASAYRKKAFNLHPDRAGSTSEATENMAFLNSQYDKVKDPEERYWYDQDLLNSEYAKNMSNSKDSRGGSGDPGNVFDSTSQSNPRPFASNSSAGPSDFFGSFGSADQPRPQPFTSNPSAGPSQGFFGSFGSANHPRPQPFTSNPSAGPSQGFCGPFNYTTGTESDSGDGPDDDFANTAHAKEANFKHPRGGDIFPDDFVNPTRDQPDLGAGGPARHADGSDTSVPAFPVSDPGAKEPRASPRPWSWFCCCGIRLRWLLLGAFVTAFLVAGGYTITHGSPKEALSDLFEFDFDVDWRSHYQVLNVSSYASSKEIRKAYHIRISQLHPDKTRDDAVTNREFRKVMDAYETLSDTIDRCIYDNSWIAGNRAMFVACTTAKAQIVRAKAEQDWKDFVADQKASKWRQDWKDNMEGTREAEEGSLLPLIREATYSVMVVIEDLRIGCARWGGHFKVLVQTLILRVKLLVS
ncbi:hypothetical protein VMCG_04177 [Cytospora schulzeri]|uniref:J domain-containing protein n=1 Tax=Cytospora schulzeri TaxID=448051 RepID=A0A423WTN6_9PEZI|nr:hypothetical protein VMCG_04177 [Valsa malicola]